MKYKLLVVDIDGTLVDKNGMVSARDKEALVRAAAAGAHVSLCTGRMPRACSRVLSQVSLEGYHMFADGALVCDVGQCREIYVRPIDPAVMKPAVAFAQEHDIELEFYSATHYFAQRETWSTSAHREFFGIEPTIVDFSGIWERERIIKAGLAVTNQQEADKANRLQRAFAGSLAISWAWTPAYPDAHFLNIVAPGVSKGKALEVLASHLGVSLSEVVAVGDGSNDLSLLATAGLAVAMDNAPEELKAVADYITQDVEHSGLAAAIERFVV